MRLEEKIEKYLDEESIKKGDTVHLALKKKGGSGHKGKVTKIEDDTVWIENEEGRTFKGTMDKVTKV